MTHRRILTVALLALMLPGLVLARASVSLCICAGPLTGLAGLVAGDDCCTPAEDLDCCAPGDAVAPAPCCDVDRAAEGEREGGAVASPASCGSCIDLMVEAVDLTFEPHAGGGPHGDDGPSVHGASAPPTTGSLPRVALGAAAERGPPGPLDRTTPVALRRGDRPMRN